MEFEQKSAFPDDHFKGNYRSFKILEYLLQLILLNNSSKFYLLDPTRYNVWYNFLVH